MTEIAENDRRTHRRTAVEVAVVLGITTTVSYGTLYYAFGVVARAMATDTGMSLTSVYGVFSFGLFISGLLATRAGGLFDRYDPATVMAIGSGLVVAGLGAFAMVPGQWAFICVLVALQIVSMLVLYEAAFVAAAYYAPFAVRRTITGITLIAGFASTIFWPLTAWLLDFWTWREIYLSFAAMHAVFCLAPHYWLSRRPGLRRRERKVEPSAPGMGTPRLTGKKSRKIAFVLIMIGFTANAFVISSVHLHLIGLLEAVGLAASAALIGALIGPAQVVGRFAEFVLGDRLSIFAVTLFSAAALPTGLLILLWTAPWLTGAVIFAVLFGLGQGLSYIARGVFPLELFGADGFGRLTGRINAVRLFVSAGAPFLTAAIFERAGAAMSIYAIVFTGIAALAAFVAIGPLLRRN